MPIVLGNTSISGLTAGGLGSGVVTTALIVDANVTAAKITNGTTSSASGSGYMKFPNGLLMQWTQSGGQGGEGDVSGSWPIAFNTILRVICMSTEPGGSRDGMMQLRSYSTTGYNIRANSFNAGGGTLYGDLIAFGT
jgi:hypothetical protein